MAKTFVLVYLLAPQGNPDVLRDAFRRTSWVGAGIGGLLRAELLADADDPNGFVLLSEWVSLAAFRVWQRGPDHESGGKTSPLRPYHDRSRRPHYVIYQQWEAGDRTPLEP